MRKYFNQLNYKTILKHIPAEFHIDSTIILFGSVARGDSQELSDIDIAIVSNDFKKSSSVSSLNLNITCYTKDKLVLMAKDGSLFVRHLFTEGEVLKGDLSLLNQLRNEFDFSNDLLKYRSELIFASKLLDIGLVEYLENWKKYNILSLYLFRSFLYLKAQRGNIESFSINVIASKLNDESIKDVFNIKYDNRPSFSHFLEVKSRIEIYSEVAIKNEFETFEALLVNSLDAGNLTSWLAIRLKSNEEVIFRYD